MVPDKFNMVDMGGIDLIMVQGEEVPGLYMRLVESIARCRYQCLYNWFFDGIAIPPTYVILEVNEDDEVVINEGVVVTDDDVIHIYSIEPPPPEPEIIPLLVEENGTYTVPAGKDGFNPVTVDVPSYTPVINPISITENGTYIAPSGVDGYSPVVVSISGGSTILSGANEPTSAIGSNGDIYLQTLDLLQPLVASQSDLSIIVTASTNWGGYDPWKAFSSVSNNWWIGAGGDPHWLQVEFQSQQTLNEVNFITYDNSRTHPISRIAYSNNGVDFTDAVLSESTTSGLSGHAVVSGGCTGKYFRFIFDGSYGASYYPGMGKVEMFGAGSLISASYCKVNGIWQNLIGTDINDVNT